MVAYRHYGSCLSYVLHHLPQGRSSLLGKDSRSACEGTPLADILATRMATNPLYDVLRHNPQIYTPHPTRVHSIVLLGIRPYADTLGPKISKA